MLHNVVHWRMTRMNQLGYASRFDICHVLVMKTDLKFVIMSKKKM